MVVGYEWRIFVPIPSTTIQHCALEHLDRPSISSFARVTTITNHVARIRALQPFVGLFIDQMSIVDRFTKVSSGHSGSDSVATTYDVELVC